MSTIKPGLGATTTTTTTTTTAPPSSQANLECCMCGDCGLSSELFRCKVCQFRSQHRYCSNQYPKAESYRVCNWCLSQKDDSVEKAQQNSSNSSSSYKSNNNEEDIHTSKNKSIINSNNNNNNGGGFSKGQKGILRLQINSHMAIKKQKSPEISPSSTTARKRNITSVESVEERIRRTRSEPLSNTNTNGGIMKQVFRNKVRRYKLLDEVSS